MTLHHDLQAVVLCGKFRLCVSTNEFALRSEVRLSRQIWDTLVSIS